MRTVSRCRPNTREASRTLIPSTITARRTRRYTSTLYIHRTIRKVEYNPIDGGGRYRIQPPFVSNRPPTRSTLPPPFTTTPTLRRGHEVCASHRRRSAVTAAEKDIMDLSPAENVAATWYRSTPSHSSSRCLSREFLSPLAPPGVANRVQRRPTWRIRGPRYARSNPYYGSYRVSLRRSRLHHRVCLAENAQKTLPRARYFIRPWHRRSNRRNPGNPRHGRRLRPNPSRPSRRSHCAV